MLGNYFSIKENRAEFDAVRFHPKVSSWFSNALGVTPI